MFKFSGKVEVGQKRGRKLGFPTVNIPLPFPIPEGIFISRVKLGERNLHALTFIGAARTFGETKIISETYILDFDEDIYGSELEVELLSKIRENQKFENVDQLVEQMERDKKMALEFFLKSKEK